MYTVISVYDPDSDTKRLIKARRVVYDVLANNGLPLCAWCRLNALRPLTDVIQRGFTVDFVQTVGYCDSCQKGTIVEYEIPHEGESEVEF